MKIKFSYQHVSGIGYSAGICRRDPSNVIKVGNTCHIWYSKVKRGRELYPSGYFATVWHATSVDDGFNWKEHGEAVGTSQEGFDSNGVFTPNILFAGKKSYLAYTAVEKGFSNYSYSDINRTAIGMAVADSPDGPWKKIDSNPILVSSRDPSKFDSFRVDDSCFIARDGKYWLYYKGRQWENTPSNTKMGVAIAEHPEGPYIKSNGGNPVQDSGHEVLVWPYRKGVISLVSNTGSQGKTLQYADDGLHFKMVSRLPKNFPKAPGAYRADFSGEPEYDEAISWGISMVPGKDPYLIRHEIKITGTIQKE